MVVKARFVKLLEYASDFDFSRVIRGRVVVDGGRRLEAEFLGVKYRVEMSGDNVKLEAFDPLNRTVDSSRLIDYVLNAMERALKHGIPQNLGRLIRLAQLPARAPTFIHQSNNSFVRVGRSA